MKRIFKGLICLLIVTAMMAVSLSGCSSLGKTLLKYEDTELSENMYMLFLSRVKGNLSSAANFGTEPLYDSFWDTFVSADGTTRADYYKEEVLNDAKFYVAALHTFDSLGLKLPASYIDEIDKELSELVEYDADGSKTAFNGILSEYGANYDVLREAYIVEAKLAYLSEYLYGADGSKIGDEIIEEYYQQNYFRFKHVFFYTYALVYKEDSNGHEIYYLTDGSGRIAYDTGAKKKRDESGAEVKDKNGDTVYVNESGAIAYDKAKGQREPVYDENGYVMTREFTDAELYAVSDHATLLMEKLEGEEGNYTLFDSYVENYSEDVGSLEYSNGFYMTADSNYDSPEVLAALSEMEVGEIRKVYSEYGIHIVMKYELDKGGYADEENSDFFISTSTGRYSFLGSLMSMLLVGYLSPISESVWVDSELYETIDPRKLGANFYY